MRLSYLHEQGHWAVMGGHPGSMGPKKKKKGQYSFYVHPEDRPGYEKRMGLRKDKEEK